MSEATDVEWVAKAMRAFAWMAPGEVSVYGLDQLEGPSAGSAPEPGGGGEPSG